MAVETDPTVRPLRRAFDRAMYEAKMAVARVPVLAMPVARIRGHGVVVDRDTDVLIEGYPRSANSFAVAAFGLAQPGPVRIAHHTHAPAHVIAAVRMGVPAIVLVRNPEEAVVGAVIHKPSYTVRQALRAYIAFYGPLLPYLDRIVVGPFHEVTTDFGAVIHRLNERCGTAFVPFEHTPENQQACFEAMDGYWRGKVGSGMLLERVVGRPSEKRERLKEALRDRYRAPALASQRARATELHEAFAAAPPTAGLS